MNSASAILVKTAKQRSGLSSPLSMNALVSDLTESKSQLVACGYLANCEPQRLFTDCKSKSLDKMAKYLLLGNWLCPATSYQSGNAFPNSSVKVSIR